MTVGEGADALAQRLGALRQLLPATTRLLAVSKGQPAGVIRRAVAAGQRSFAESRLQEAIAKQSDLADLPPLDWHFIGRLQANKARAVLRHFGTIHSVDSLALAVRLQRRWWGTPADSRCRWALAGCAKPTAPAETAGPDESLLPHAHRSGGSHRCRRR